MDLSLDRIILKNLKFLREKKGYSQEYIASCIGVTQSCYAKLENGISELSIKKLIEISTILEEDILHIICCESKKFNHVKLFNFVEEYEKLYFENRELKIELLELYRSNHKKISGNFPDIN